MKQRIVPFISALIVLTGVFFVVHGLTAKDVQKAAKHEDVDFSISCVECHQEATPQAVKEWRESKHGMMNFACYLCHGDGVESFEPKPSTEKCIGCHSGQQVDPQKAPGMTCFDCHNGHTLKFHK